MYSILLVDDEKSIREHLTKAISFEEHGFYVRSTALNGKEAMEKLPAVRPDLILLDVRMPVMDGLEFLKQLRQSEFAGTKVVMLSGYNEFEYAKEAMKYGVKAYVNKPADEEEVIPLLEMLRRELDNHRNEKDRSDLQECMNLFYKLYNGASISRKAFEGYVIMTCVLLQFPAMEPEKVHSALQQCLTGQLSELDSLQIGVKGSLFSYLLPPQNIKRFSSLFELANFLKDELKKVPLDCAFLFDSYVFQHSMDTFREDMANHSYEMLTELFFSGGYYMEYGSDRYKTGGELFLEVKYLEEMKQHILDINSRMAIQVAEKIINEVQKERTGIQYIQEISYRIYYLIADEISSRLMCKQVEPVFPRPKWMESLCFITFPKWRELLCSMIKEGFELIEQNYRNKNPSVCKEIVNYIHKHYMEQISLKQIADKFYINAAYLGRVFLKSTGVSFKDYVNQLRICEAKKLLLQTDKMIYEIANKVGFMESSYFIVKFTQEVGKSPTEYRSERSAPV